jgi:hypothetical protein
VAVGPPDVGTNYQGGSIWYRRLQWSGTNTLWNTNWFTVSDGGLVYRDYFDVGGTNPAVLPGTGIVAPHKDGSPGIDLFRTGSRLMATVIRNGFMWTCHTVGLNGTNGAYQDDLLGTNVDRTAIQWLRIGIDPGGNNLTLNTFGRVFDVEVTNAWWYYFPSLAVNCTGDMVAGFSGSSMTNYIGAFYTSRLANSSILSQPRAIQSGVTNYIFDRLGDYSATVVDPTDDWSFWTVQAYAAPWQAPWGAVGSWGTVVAKIRPQP